MSYACDTLSFAVLENETVYDRWAVRSSPKADTSTLPQRTDRPGDELAVARRPHRPSGPDKPHNRCSLLFMGFVGMTVGVAGTALIVVGNILKSRGIGEG